MNYYRLLGLTAGPDALTDKLVRDAYYRLAKECHPDVRPGDFESAQRFKAVSHAYEMLKTAENRRRVLLEDDDFHRKMNARGVSSDYAADFRNVEEEFRSAEKEWKQANKRTHRLMNSFEAFIHPRVLLVLLPATVFVYYCISSSVKDGLLKNDKQQDKSPSQHKQQLRLVDAWLNPRTGRWESAAPWDSEYRKALAAGTTKKMQRADITESQR